jgi:cellulose biosynthesis protein BcsQ
MKLISVFNNKGGVGKTTLTFHLGHALAELGKKVLLVDVDPQCNLTILCLPEETIHEMWRKEDDFIEDFQAAKDSMPPAEFHELTLGTRTIHFALKPTEDGRNDLDTLTKPFPLDKGLDLIPGRLSLHLYEDKISARWSDVYQGDPLAVRTVTKIRDLAQKYATQFGYDCVILDTSPSLGMLNRVLISTADGFVIPCLPDLFSLYGIKNIGNALTIWSKQFSTIKHLLSQEKVKAFPAEFVRLLGFTIYNAKKYTGQKNSWDLATAHFNYAQKIPGAIEEFIPTRVRQNLTPELMRMPIGERAVMHTHNTLPSSAQKYHTPIWKLPNHAELEPQDASTIRGNRANYENTQEAYAVFAKELLSRMEQL